MTNDYSSLYLCMNVFVLLFYDNNMFQQYYILFPFCRADSTIVAFVPLAVEDDICMIHWYLCFLKPVFQKYQGPGGSMS
jgi:hypothetical protein